MVFVGTTFKGIMNLLSKTTLPIGWDDPEKHAEMKEVSVAVFNKVSRKSYK